MTSKIDSSSHPRLPAIHKKLQSMEKAVDKTIQRHEQWVHDYDTQPAQPSMQQVLDAINRLTQLLISGGVITPEIEIRQAS